MRNMKTLEEIRILQITQNLTLTMYDEHRLQISFNL